MKPWRSHIQDTPSLREVPSDVSSTSYNVFLSELENASDAEAKLLLHAKNFSEAEMAMLSDRYKEFLNNPVSTSESSQGYL